MSADSELSSLRSRNEELERENGNKQRRIDGLINGCAHMASNRYDLAGLLGKTVAALRSIIPAALDEIGPQRAIGIEHLCDEAARVIVNIPAFSSPPASLPVDTGKGESNG